MISFIKLSNSDVPTTKESSGLLRDDEKRRDGLTIFPWQNSWCLTWDATVTGYLAISYLSSASSLPGSATEAAVIREWSKYATIMLIHIFVQVAVETLGTDNAEGLRFLDQIGDRLLPLLETHESPPLCIKGYLSSYNVSVWLPFAAPWIKRRIWKFSHSRLFFLSFLTLWIFTAECTKKLNSN